MCPRTRGHAGKATIAHRNDVSPLESERSFSIGVRP